MEVVSLDQISNPGTEVRQQPLADFLFAFCLKRPHSFFKCREGFAGFSIQLLGIPGSLFLYSAFNLPQTSLR
jgi:hypothetical protein